MASKKKTFTTPRAALFHLIEGGQVVIRKPKGIYVQASLYYRGDSLYAAVAGGFVRMYSKGGTSHPEIKFDPDAIDLDDESGVTISLDDYHIAVSVAPELQAAE